MKSVRKPYHSGTTEDILADLKRVAKELNRKTLGAKEYDRSIIGMFRSRTIRDRFGRWNIALEKAGLEIGLRRNITDQELIDDLKRVADQITPMILTQEKYDELGEYSANTIWRHLGWKNSLEKLGIISGRHKLSEAELFNNLEENLE